MRHAQPLGGIVLSSLLLLALPSCSLDPYAPPRDSEPTDRMMRGDDAPSTGQIEVEQQAPSIMTLDALTAFSEETIRAAPATGSILCLPAVTQDNRNGVRVTELGVDIADRIAQEIGTQGYAGQVLSTVDAQVIAARGNVDRATLSSLPAVREHGVRFGADVIVFGTIKVTRNAGDVGRNTLRYDLTGYDVMSERVVSRRGWTISNRTTGSAYELTRLDQESAWMPESQFAAAPVEPKLSTEIEIATRALASRIAPRLKQQPAKAYLAPLDSSEFVRAVSFLRSAQAIFADEYETRLRMAAASAAGGRAEPLDVQKPLVIHDTEFPSLQAAKAYMVRLREALQASSGARFGESFSAQLGQDLQRMLGDGQLQIVDLGFTEWSDTQLVEGQLALGGITRSKIARDILKKSGIRYVIQPRLEKLSKVYLFRVQVFDVEAGNVFASTHFPVQESFGPELSEELGIHKPQVATGAPQPRPQAPKKLPKAAPRDEIRTAARDWSEIYKEAVRAAVMVVSKKGWGSGFLVENGYVLTNHHVIDKIEAADEPQIIFADGSRAPYTVLASDPRWDVAVLKPAKLPQGVGTLKLAEAEKAAVGKAVAVLGRPKQTLGWVLSPGYISSLTEMSPITKTRRWMYTCPTRGGNSGSPVLLDDGTVVAVHSEGSLGNLGGSKNFTELTGFARGVPISEVRKFLERVVAGN
jgi:S1-C subfamily serine protease